MKVYLAEMFPIPLRLASSALLCISFITFLGRIHEMKISIYSRFTFIGTWSIFTLMLILRLMDELKDREIDKELFSDRPLPSGKVLESDIRFSLLGLMILYLVGNMFLAQTFWMAVFVLGYSLLMFKYFFIPRILRRYLLLNLMAHNPIIAIMLFYLVSLFSVEHGLNLRNLKWPSTLLLIAMYWTMFFAWEIARKIRSREEENAYVTYSQIFGPLGAVFIAGGAQTIGFLIGLNFFFELSLPKAFLAILLIGYGMTIWGYILFIIKPNPVTSKLKPFAERYILSVLGAHIFGQITLA